MIILTLIDNIFSACYMLINSMNVESIKINQSIKIQLINKLFLHNILNILHNI